jgi:ubiquinone/menaquinone biosynthesis C-methylase UbiE
MEKDNIKVQYFYDDLIYGVKPTLDNSEAMLKAFPYPTIKQLPDLNVLEVGLGRGEWALGLATYSKRYTGVDYSNKTIEYVKSELISHCLKEKNIFLRHGSVLDLPYDNNTFDIAYCIGVLHATPDPLQGFRELIRVLKPGGVLNIMLYGRVQPRNIIRDILFIISRLGSWAEDLILKLVLKLENWKLPDAWFFNAEGNTILYRDWYFAPIQSHHTIREIYSWAHQNNVEVSYVFLDQYRNTLKRHQRWANNKITGWLLCPDFMASITKPSTLK